MVTIRVYTAAGTNASGVGEAYGSIRGVAWRNSVDACDRDGGGRVFLDCDSEDVADYVRDQLDSDDDVTLYNG
jgi:hypothetical protein